MRVWSILFHSSLLPITLGFPQQAARLASSNTQMSAAPRILALHGSEGTASSLQTTLQGVLQHCEITTLQAPFVKGSGFAWWQLPPGERSFTAKTYEGYQESAALVRQALQQTDFDVILGHSQGAILLVAMIADGQLASRRIVLNGVAWPNPFSEQLLSCEGNFDVLQIVGVHDRINPPEQALRVGEALRSRGCKTTLLHHPGGHSIPSDETVWRVVSDWLAQKPLDAVLFVDKE